jgi:hypothetical protein
MSCGEIPFPRAGFNKVGQLRDQYTRMRQALNVGWAQATGRPRRIKERIAPTFSAILQER